MKKWKKIYIYHINTTKTVIWYTTILKTIVWQYTWQSAGMTKIMAKLKIFKKKARVHNAVGSGQTLMKGDGFKFMSKNG